MFRPDGIGFAFYRAGIPSGKAGVSNEQSMIRVKG